MNEQLRVIVPGSLAERIDRLRERRGDGSDRSTVVRDALRMLLDAEDRAELAREAQRQLIAERANRLGKIERNAEKAARMAATRAERERARAERVAPERWNDSGPASENPSA
jgi:Arc/MetJ-type ribon-helix-helix transcriptional regulator